MRHVFKQDICTALVHMCAYHYGNEVTEKKTTEASNAALWLMPQKCLLEQFLDNKSQIKQQRQTLFEHISVEKADLYAYLVDNVNFLRIHQAIL